MLNSALNKLFRRPRSHIIISGTGRAGTTLLVQYFTCLGLDTGYTKSNMTKLVDPISNAGLEHRINDAHLPNVIKSPWISDDLDEALESNFFQVEYAVVPIRDLRSAAESRRRVFEASEANGMSGIGHPGSLWKTVNPGDQEEILSKQLYKLVECLVRHSIPIAFLPFPLFAQNHQILYKSLRPILEVYGIDQAASKQSFDEVVQPSLIHRF